MAACASSFIRAWSRRIGFEAETGKIGKDVLRGG